MKNKHSILNIVKIYTPNICVLSLGSRCSNMRKLTIKRSQKLLQKTTDLTGSQYGEAYCSQDLKRWGLWDMINLLTSSPLEEITPVLMEL